MAALVIDCSTTLGFLLKDEQGEATMKALAALEKGAQVFVPAQWGWRWPMG